MPTQSKGNPAPIPPEFLGAWWQAAGAAPSIIAADYYRSQLLTGCRSVEIHGSKRHRYPLLVVGDVERHGGRIVLRYTKNRSDHKSLLSPQAAAIVERNCVDKETDDPLLPIVDAGKTLTWAGGQQDSGVRSKSWCLHVWDGEGSKKLIHDAGCATLACASAARGSAANRRCRRSSIVTTITSAG